MEQDMGTRGSYSARVAAILARFSGRIIVAAVLLTLLLAVPVVTESGVEEASSDPTGEVFDLRDDLNKRFTPSVHGTGYIVESRTGDILTQAALWELYRNEQRLREADEAGDLAPEGLPSQPYLYRSYDVEANRPFLGVYSLADAVRDALAADPRLDTTLETATDDQVKTAIHQLLSSPGTSRLKGDLSADARGEARVLDGREITYWTAPALVLGVLADNERLGGGASEIALGGGEVVQNKERFNRNVQALLRGEQGSYQLWGVAIDVTLESADEGQTAGMFIMLTVIAVVLVAGASLRSYWAVALTGVGLGGLMIWLKGISSLVGIKGGLVIDLIVPIAMVSLGVDFALHALRRYQEERGRGYAPGLALRVGFAGVLGALALAMLSDGIAFLSNTSSGIEAVIHFGIAAGIAVFSSFVVLGMVVPLAMMRIDQVRGPSSTPTSGWSRILVALGCVGVAAFSGAGVILLVAVSAPLGVAVLLAASIVCLGAPLLFVWWRRSGPRQSETATGWAEPGTTPQGEPGGWLVAAVVGLARQRLPVLLVASGVTAAAVLFATRLEATFDAKDFFDPRADFVVSLDKIDEHIGKSGGEPGIIYIKGALSDPGAVAAIDRFIGDLANNPDIAKYADGEPQVSPESLGSLLRRIVGSEHARGRVEAVTGVRLTDAEGDGLPDSQAQIRASYEYMLAEGVPLDDGTLVYTPGLVREALFLGPVGSREDVAAMTVFIPGTREQKAVEAAHASLTSNLEVLRESPSIARVGITGSAFTRLAQLDASTKTLQRSLPIAVVATLALLIVAMRSLRYAVVSIIPIGLVVTWLYALMYLTGFALNYVTATIGAVSVGVGIDYSIHMTERFREELRNAPTRIDALRRAAGGTGVALLASAVSSILGFAIMGFAPMPMFSSYGTLTAIMIFLALSSSLVVLPSLLLLVTPERTTEAENVSKT